MKMPLLTLMTTCNSDLNESKLIREAEEMESDCIICNTSALVDIFIICSLCSKNVHYKCNNPNVSAYYKIIL